MTTAPPSGTVTFLFTDIEGSTRLLETLGETYDRVLEEHRAILLSAAADNSGHVVGTEGDSFFMVFERATDAVLTALGAQQTLARHPWPEGGQVKVRMGLHTGETRLLAGSYVGIAVHKCQRISNAGHGGQTLVSSITLDLAAPVLSGVAVSDLGSHRLKDLSAPERIYQISHQGADERFPPLRTLDVLPNNLPSLLTSFVGRTEEIQDLKGLLDGSRLVTILGPGGAGKTRLALQTAAEVLDTYPDGAWMVDLAPATDEDQVAPAIASTLGFVAGSGPAAAHAPAETAATTLEHIVSRTRNSKMLLILDNCEHLIAASAGVAEELLAMCPQMTILATSRAPLGVTGETRWRIKSLSLPEGGASMAPDEVSTYESIRLFVERAALNQPQFALTPSTAPIVTGICARLDGMPLAIELAAAWVHALSPEQVLERLDDQFKLLASTTRRGPERQQTIRATVEWSYALLTEPERRLLENLSIFAGGFTMEGAERVCATHGVAPGEVLFLLSSLIDKSLVLRDQETGRYGLLETIKQFGFERLEAEPKQPPPAEQPATDMLFLREGEFWSVGPVAKPARLKHSKGLEYLRTLLKEPGREFHVLDIVGAGHAEIGLRASGALEVSDPKALAAYRARLGELEEEAADARAMNDPERAAVAEKEAKAIEDELAAAYGLAGRSRKSGSASERARMSVGKAVRTSLDRIEEHAPGVGGHLIRAVRLGVFCSYDPSPTDVIRWKLDVIPGR
ncbi:MAG TPA: adenylate/guanylate cyclase domain-containing protein [Actinomycetota bacterium]|nr:adenylate/guanylate cyclase domain-containing protein [Actinomycetota bacterium]